MQILGVSTKDQEEAVNILAKGGLVIYPTETAYGAGVDATNKLAVGKLLEFKKRPTGKAISIACSSYSMAQSYVIINKAADNLYKEFLPGPLTIVSFSKNKVDKRLESEDSTLGVRIPNNEFALGMIEKLKRPVTATSANSFGNATPYSIESILENLTEKQKSIVDLIIDAGHLPKRLTSTVVDTTRNTLRTFRKGAIKFGSNKPQKVIVSKNVEETLNLAEILTKNLLSDGFNNIVYLLSGELGAGKTHFAKGVAKALGVNAVVKSPTYGYVSEYKIPYSTQKFIHVDAWKIVNKRELEALGLNNLIKTSKVVVIEWPEVIENLDKDFFNKFKPIAVYIDSIDEQTRKMSIFQ